MNDERRRLGLPALQLTSQLTSVARLRSEDMIANADFAHFGPNGQSAYALLSQFGALFTAGGENLARVSGGAAESVTIAFDGLARSPTHRVNIVDARFTRVGVGAVTDSQGITIFTTIFTD